MASRTDKLYLIRTEARTGVRTVAVILGKDPLEAINKYLERVGFTNPRAYFYSCLMTNTITTNTRTYHSNEYCFIAAITGTISGNFTNISSQLVVSCDDIFSLVYEDINNPLFVRPTIEEVRKCTGFSEEPMYKLKKFCI